MASRKTTRLWIVLLAAAGSRLALELLSMPPYAGLDEGFHVGRVSFVAKTGHNPDRGERSLPLYLARSMGGDPSSPFDFAMLGKRWPEIAAGRRAKWADPQVSARDGLSMVAENYEAQQPSLYYSLFGRLLRALPGRTQLGELLLLRTGAGVLGLVCVIASAWAAARLYGMAGFLAGSLFVVAPAWLSLVCHSGNDALAVAASAVGLALALGRRGTPSSVGAEAVAWSAAVASKLTAWPITTAAVVVAPGRRWSKWRNLIVAVSIVIAAGLTALDLHRRTGSLLGDQGLTGVPLATATGRGRIDIVTPVKVFVASAIWPGAQHGNALTGKAMILYGVVVLAFVGVGLFSCRRRIRYLGLVLVTLFLFAIAQAGHAWGFFRDAVRAGIRLPAAGFEGWYLWTLAPLLVATLLAASLRGLRRHPVLLVALTLWLLVWDVLIHECGIYRDYAGLTSPEYGNALFRWGSIPGGFSGLGQLANLSASGAPLAVLLSLRALHVAATVLLLVLVIRRIGTRRAHP